MSNKAVDENLRRKFIKGLITVPALMAVPDVRGEKSPSLPVPGPRLKLSLNAYSFNKQLLDGSMSIDDMLEFCAEKELVACDLTAYYFKSYPEVPSDDELYRVKRKAFRLGVEISGTGVRNDFTHADRQKRRESVQLVKNWIEAAQKLGAQTIRIFSGNQRHDRDARSKVVAWMVRDIQECVDYGKAHGVVVALQNHDDFIKTAADTREIMEAIRSDWYGLMLDIGSFRTADPYDEIAQTIRYAVTWQIKEKVYIRGKETDVDADRLVDLIRKHGFRGYLPLEALGEGDPKQKVSALLEKFRRALQKS